MYKRFLFEGDVHRTLATIPLSIRRKLDLSGQKLSLAGWEALSREERLCLCHMPVDGEGDLDVYREVLAGFATRAGVPALPLFGDPIDPAAWSAARLAPRLRAKLGDAKTPGEDRLGALGEEERYALFKLSEPRREPDKLVAVLGELGLG
ncbi:MAG: nitrate reductase associated protein [Byssovorax sp.]